MSASFLQFLWVLFGPWWSSTFQKRTSNTCRVVVWAEKGKCSQKSFWKHLWRQDIFFCQKPFSPLTLFLFFSCPSSKVSLFFLSFFHSSPSSPLAFILLYPPFFPLSTVYLLFFLLRFLRWQVATAASVSIIIRGIIGLPNVRVFFFRAKLVALAWQAQKGKRFWENLKWRSRMHTASNKKKIIATAAFHLAEAFGRI